MNERQREYFRMKLRAWKSDILKEVKETLLHLQDEIRITPILLTALPPRQTGQSSCAPVIGSAS